MKKFIYLLLIALFSFGVTNAQKRSSVHFHEVGKTYQANTLVSLDGDIYKAINITTDTPPSVNWEQVGQLIIPNLQQVTAVDSVTSNSLVIQGARIFNDSADNNFFLGENAGTSASGVSIMGVGKNAAQNNTGFFAGTHIGFEAGQNNNGTSVTNLGYRAGTNADSDFSVNLGREAGFNDIGSRALNIGTSAGRDNEGEFVINIGQSAGVQNEFDFVANFGQVNATQSNQVNFAMNSARGFRLNMASGNAIREYDLQAKNGTLAHLDDITLQQATVGGNTTDQGIVMNVGESTDLTLQFATDNNIKANIDPSGIQLTDDTNGGKFMRFRMGSGIQNQITSKGSLGSSNAGSLVFAFPDNLTGHTISLPADKSGTVALLSDITGGSTPNLQTVLDEGASATTPIIISGASGSTEVGNGYLNISGTSQRLIAQNANDGTIAFRNTGLSLGTLRAINQTSNVTWDLPDQSGTIALLSDITGGGSSIYTADGSIPAATDRELTFPTGSSLALNGGTTEFYLYDAGMSLDADELAFSVNGADQFINFSQSNPLEIISANGINLIGGTGSENGLVIDGTDLTIGSTQGLGVELSQIYFDTSGGSLQLGASSDISIDTGEDNTINMVGKVSMGLDSNSNPFNAQLNLNNGTFLPDGNNFPFYNALNKQNTTNNSDLVYGISNLIEHDGSGDISQLRGVFNRVRTDAAGTPNEIIGALNIASYRNTGSGTVSLISASENYVEIENTAGTGTINSTVALRGQVRMDNPNVNLLGGFGGVYQLDLDQGTVENFGVLELDIDQAGGTALLNSSYLFIDTGIDEVAAAANNVKVINSIVDLPSTFAGSIEAKSLSVTGGTSDQVILADGTIGENVMRKVKVTLTSTELATGLTTPVELISAQGAGTIIKVHSAIAVSNFGGSPYIIDPSPLRIYAETATTDLYSFTNGTPVFSTTSDTFSSFPEVATPSDGKNISVNQPIMFQGGDYILGNGTLDIHLTYEVIQL